jgi:ABC-type branched-subunit amino acid transport system substrate-binding protein
MALELRRIRLFGVPFLGLILLSLAGPASAQSLLSIPPEGWEPPPVLEQQGGAEGGGLSGGLTGLPGAAVGARGEAAPQGATEASEPQASAQAERPAAAGSEEGLGDEPASEEEPGLASDGGQAGVSGSEEVGRPEVASSEPALRDLLVLVEAGRGHEAYAALAEGMPAELERARQRGDDAAELERELLIHLLRAGEGLAEPEEQERTARRFIEKYPDAAGFPAAFFYLSRALFAQDKPLEESFFFDENAFQRLPAWMQTGMLTMRSRAAARRGRYLRAAEFLMTELELFSTLRATRPDEVVALLEQVDDVEALMGFLARFWTFDWLEEKKPFLRVRALINEGSVGQALLAINGILREGSATSPAQIKAIHAARAGIESRLLISPERIGVLLPLSSSSAALRELARETLDGLRMAIRFAGGGGAVRNGAPGANVDSWLPAESAKGKPRGLSPGFELVIRDTANDPERAAETMRQLAAEEHVIAVIGPIARSESTAAASAAEAHGVPLVSLSLTLEIPEDSRFVFRHSKGQEEEVRDIVRYAMDYAGARRFVLLYPETGYGRRITELFWNMVEEKGGRVVGAESYRKLAGSPIRRTGEVGLKEIFERFTGLDRPQDERDIALREALGDSRGDPIVDFDAVFIPIGPTGSQDLALIAPYPVTVDAENVLLLGNRFWNNDEVIVAGDGKLDGAVFVDAFDRMSFEPRLRNFRRLHRIMFGHRANFRAATYYTAFAYDTMTMLMQGIREKKKRTRQELAHWLVTMKPYSGVTGLTTFLETGEAVKESMFFRVESDRIRRIVP